MLKFTIPSECCHIFCWVKVGFTNCALWKVWTINGQVPILAKQDMGQKRSMEVKRQNLMKH